MQDWQVRLQLEAMAILVQVEGMKIENDSWNKAGKGTPYEQKAFNDAAEEIQRLAREIGNG